MSYIKKYLKYKYKYINLQKLFGGSALPESHITTMLEFNSKNCQDVIKFMVKNPETTKSINFNQLSKTIDIPNNIQNVICSKIGNIDRRNECNSYFNKCHIESLYKKYTPSIYTIDTLNDILLRTIPNNKNENRSDDQQALIRLGANITNIDDHLFNENELTYITIPICITNIGIGAFANNQLTELIISEFITNIDANAFNNNQLTYLKIPNSVDTIGYNAFTNNKLKQVEIPDKFRDEIWNIFDNDIEFTFT